MKLTIKPVFNKIVQLDCASKLNNAYALGGGEHYDQITFIATEAGLFFKG